MKDSRDHRGEMPGPRVLDDASVEAFDPTTNTWSMLVPLGAPRAGHAAVMMPDGLMVILGGGGGTAGEAMHF